MLYHVYIHNSYLYIEHPYKKNNTSKMVVDVKFHQSINEKH